MRCCDCGGIVEGGVRLSEYAAAHEACYEAMMEAWSAEKSLMPWATPSFCPQPMELYARIADVRRQIGDQPRHVPLDTATRGTLFYVPKRVAYRSARRGTERRE